MLVAFARMISVGVGVVVRSLAANNVVVGVGEISNGACEGVIVIVVDCIAGNGVPDSDGVLFNSGVGVSVGVGLATAISTVLL